MALITANDHVEIGDVNDKERVGDEFTYYLTRLLC